MKKDIVIIDSGVYGEHNLLAKADIEGITIKFCDGNYIVCSGADDEIGHGTAVCGVVLSEIDNPSEISILMIKIYGRTLKVELEALLFALSYIEKTVECDIIHISSGILQYSKMLEMQCTRLKNKGVCIVAAFDNEGAVSYPAAFDSVIGVDSSYDCRKGNEWIYIEKGIVNVLAKGGNHRLAWTSPQYIISQGASFSAGYITAVIAKQLKNGLVKDKISDFLRDNAKRILNRSCVKKEKPVFDFTIHRAALFPYNKEMHSLLNYCDLLPFSIQGIYSTKYLGNVGRTVRSVNGTFDFVIQSIEEIDFNSIDTLILGHVFELERTSLVHYKKYLLEKCLDYHINVYSFDQMSMDAFETAFAERGVGLFYPQVDAHEIVKKDGKLHAIGVPVLGVFGTSSVQGKYTIQLYLRRRFMESGYKLCQMGTEPSALLFGMDAMYPFGYAPTVNAKEEEAVELLNSMMHELELKDPDIILVGSQSGTIPASMLNNKYLNIQQQIFLLGTNPDAVILCVNIQDDICYIKRTIAVIENLNYCQVIAIVVSPLLFSGDFGMIRRRKECATLEQIRQFIERLNEELSSPVFSLADSEEMEQLFKSCLDYFTQEEIYEND